MPQTNTLKTDYTKPDYVPRELGKERERLLVDWRRDELEVRKILRAVEAALMAELASFDLEDATRLTKRQVHMLQRIVVRELKKAGVKIEGVLTRRIEEVVLRAIQLYDDLLVEMGLDEFSSAEQEEVLKQSRKIALEYFPIGSNLNYKKRVKRAAALFSVLLMNAIKRTYPQGTVLEGLGQMIAYTLSKTSVTGVRGGSMANKMKQIIAAESVRVAREVALVMARIRGIEFGYWRLSPSHPWYGGEEICELYAVNEYKGPGEEKLRGVRNVGLFRIDNFPEHPHPHCKCVMVPLILKNK